MQPLRSETASLRYLAKDNPYEKLHTDYDAEEFISGTRKKRKLENAEIISEYNEHGLKGLVDSGLVPILKIKDAKEALDLYSSLTAVDPRESLPL